MTLDVCSEQRCVICDASFTNDRQLLDSACAFPNIKE